MDYTQLSALQLDALKEVSNIGAGNAATALSQLLNRKIDMTVPSVNVIDFMDIYNFVSEEELVAAVLVKVLGDAPGNILFVFEKSIASNIIEVLTGMKEDEFSEMGNSVLCEIGNIISAAYMNSIARLTNLSIMPSVPAVAFDMLSAILSSTFVESAQYSDSVLEIETMLLGEDSENIGGHFYFVPNPGSLEKILNSIGVI
ncbi:MULTISPECIES: chemotaxis protein CheC [Clostridium]|uniref:CheY-P phosphatase CheC n=2 Tax=Clostridium TaxID=1485 RepID=A0A6V8SJL0_9CLOT|nr:MULTISPECIES: chemotaxis protein CheC [Clostridium]GFP77130.1 CheY-P phosphatase CheC [Clostridium fungisolvens]GKU23546.1 CheY-P-specific phosphatase CheC [Clostridium folliculivorans]GKU29662.1 CheY-P-specific phosphatase CheC [Clostridium folliculivorans]